MLVGLALNVGEKGENSGDGVDAGLANISLNGLLHFCESVNGVELLSLYGRGIVGALGTRGIDCEEAFVEEVSAGLELALGNSQETGAVCDASLLKIIRREAAS